ncbi:MAG TPA: VanW family protein [Chthonomonadaceae bacterium]|nr:VanW family protein [Chthonomonadaceae bacterium]
MRGWGPAAILLVLLFVAGGLFYQLAAPQAPEVQIAGFATTLRGRTASQRYNARRAAEALDGKTIAPGAVFSFNRTVRSWSLDEGYVKAPVSYDGELVKAYGGGVCQTSTTLYNAALLAGLPIVERHSHVFAPHYVPPGRDAAVAQYNIDLRFRNPYPWPIRIRAEARNDRLDIRLLGRQRPSTHVEVTSEVLSAITPLRLTRVLHRREGATGRAYIRNPGATGYRVVTYRIFSRSGREIRRERLADDTYEAMNRIVQLTEDEVPQIPAGE